MKPEERIFLAVVIVVVDLMVPVIPVTGCFVAYVLIARPAFVKRWFARVYSQY